MRRAVEAALSGFRVGVYSASRRMLDDDDNGGIVGMSCYSFGCRTCFMMIDYFL